jgi:NadR type nicotinamide-nucleotide adenylyltransferase
MEKDNAKPIKVVITGPESTGKSFLCTELAAFHQTSYVPEYAREYLADTDGKYDIKDLTRIAEGQIKLEDEFQRQNGNLIICDTSLEVIRIWSEWKYAKCDSFILEQAKVRIPDLFLLMTPDLPWQPDDLRENPHDRDEIFAYYQKILKEYEAPVVEISGDKDSRFSKATEAINSITRK